MPLDLLAEEPLEAADFATVSSIAVDAHARSRPG